MRPVPGLVALHGNCMETLADALIDWSCRNPLNGLEPEIVLVQSNGTAEWFKMRMAQRAGVCAGVHVELPARFAWRTWRQVLGKAAVPRHSALDKLAMTWRLMRLLPVCLAQAQHIPEQAAAFAPITHFLRADEPQRLLQLCYRLADLFDQYQVYRSDWLECWEHGRDVLSGLRGQAARPLPDGQQWQPLLWRAVLADLSLADRATIRTAVQERVQQRLLTAAPGSLPVAPRVVILGLSHVPLSMLEFLAALSRHTQVVLAVPNPCRFHWADAIDGRDLLRIERRRHTSRIVNGVVQELGQIPLEAMHVYAHPLLAAWGRQNRDCVRLLDEFDTTHRSAQPMQWPRVDLFDDAPADTGSLLQQVQRSIRDLLPLAEHPRTMQPQHGIAQADRSIVFHSAHNLVRELEVLQDQLLSALAAPSAPEHGPLEPYDIVVMLPDIGKAAPSIRAVFGQYGRHDPRYIPFDIADLGAHANSPLITALQWLLRLPQRRCRLSELCDLLDVPALAARFQLATQDAPRLRQWMAGAGIRWGLNQRQRGSLGLDTCGEHNSAWFGLRRMLLGYASGSHGMADPGNAQLHTSAAWCDIEPYDEVGGLDAGLAGILAAVLERLLHWWEAASHEATPSVWAQRLRELMQALFVAQDDLDQAVLAALDQALTDWLYTCEQACYDQKIPLVVAQQAWLDALEQPALTQRFRAGGVTFCTLMPMRAIPFEMVCLLGMNDGDYPRRVMRSDFDLMQLPGQYRPGDRAPQDQDRQLMLEALLSARRTLYISWSGHHIRDNSIQPPSVLVSQLRDYLSAGWRAQEGELPCHAVAPDVQPLLLQRTSHHPLQPFSRGYFEHGSPLSTYASEWQFAHIPPVSSEPASWHLDTDVEAKAQTTFLTLAQLASFLRHPARSFFRQRLHVYFDADAHTVDDDEPFQLNGLHAYGVVTHVQQRIVAAWEKLEHQAQQRDGAGCSGDVMAQLLKAQLYGLQRAGRLPLAGVGRLHVQELHASLLPGLSAWQRLRQHYSQPAQRQRLHFQHLVRSEAVAQQATLDDWLEQLRLPATPAGYAPAWIDLEPRDVTHLNGQRVQPHPERLLPLYVRSLVAAACGISVDGWVVGREQCLHITPMSYDVARAALQDMLQAWVHGQYAVLPVPCRTALAWAQSDVTQVGGHSIHKIVPVYEGSFHARGEGQDLYWARLFPDFEALSADGRFAQWAGVLYAPLLAWCREHVALVAWEDLP